MHLHLMYMRSLCVNARSIPQLSVVIPILPGCLRSVSPHQPVAVLGFNCLAQGHRESSWNRTHYPFGSWFSAHRSDYWHTYEYGLVKWLIQESILMAYVLEYGSQGKGVNCAVEALLLDFPITRLAVWEALLYRDDRSPSLGPNPSCAVQFPEAHPA
ncbi:hypothetical protein MHYP_G00339430 [Metynnis hypsauchen]